MNLKEQLKIKEIIEDLKVSYKTDEDLINGSYDQDDLLEFFIASVEHEKYIAKQLKVLLKAD